MDDVFDQIGMHAIDLEPNMGVEGASDVVVRGNHFGSYGLDADWDSWVLAACGPDTGAVIKDVTVTGNTVEGNIQGWSGKMKALSLRICGDRGPRSNFVVTDNVAESAVAGPAMNLHPGRWRDRHRQHPAALDGRAGHVPGLDRRDLLTADPYQRAPSRHREVRTGPLYAGSRRPQSCDLDAAARLKRPAPWPGPVPATEHR